MFSSVSLSPAPSLSSSGSSATSSEVIVPSRGCVYTYTPKDTTGGIGYYKLEPNLQGTADAPVLITGVQIQDTDIVQPVSTLNEKNFLYVYGKGVGSVTISGLVLMGNIRDGQSESYGKVLDYFNANRVSKRMNTISISLPSNKAYKFYLTSKVDGDANAEFNTKSFSLQGVLLEPPSVL